MRVAIFIDDFSATGVVINAIAIAKQLHTEGHTVQLVATRAEGALIDTVPANIPVIGLLSARKARSSRRGRLRQSIPAFRRLLKKCPPDVLFSAGAHGHLLSLFVSLGIPGCRTIIRISNDLDQKINGKPSRPFSQWWRAAKFWVMAKLADQMVFVSRHMVRNRAISKKNSIQKAIVIPNGVDVKEVCQRADESCPHQWIGNGSDIPLIVGVGRLELQKNFANLLRAVAIARQSRPLRLLLIGFGSLQDELLREAALLGISDSVKIIPPISNPIPYLAQASVVAVPSWWEGSSNVLLEALACGTPVVASRTAGNAEDVLAYGRFGLLVDPDDIEGMAVALLIQSSDLAQRPGERALEFSRASALRAYTELIGAQSF